MKAIIGVLVNDEEVFYKHFAGLSGVQIIGVFNHDSASTGLNYLLDEMEKLNYDTGIFLHQDVELPAGWIGFVERRLEELPSDWMVAGVWGINGNKEYHGNIMDTRIKVMDRSGKMVNVGMRTDELPIKVDALDEVCLIVKLKSGFRFDQEMVGYDLYGTHACLWAKKNGYSSWAINSPFKHHTTRSFDWSPDEMFMKNWQLLKEKFEGLPVVSTCYNDEEERE